MYSVPYKGPFPHIVDAPIHLQMLYTAHKAPLHARPVPHQGVIAEPSQVEVLFKCDASVDALEKWLLHWKEV